jgi:tetratricopeptide (TPR) repeat protein
MKKAVFLCAGILIAAYLVLSLVDRDGTYNMERRVWQLNKQYAALAKDPGVVPSKAFDDLAGEYQAVIDKYPDAPMISKVHLLLGRVFFLKKDFAAAREAFQRAVKLFPDNKELCAEAMLMTGNTYEAENKIEDAVKVYRNLLSEYPLTTIGLKMPLYITLYYFKNEQQIEGESSARTAIEYYRRVINDHPNTLAEFFSHNLLADTYFANKQWKEGVDVLAEILNKYARSRFLVPRRVQTIVNFINNISINRFNDFDYAVNIYKNFIAAHPDHPLNDDFEKIIIELRRLEERQFEAATD